jgi:acyl carrier protein
MLSEMDPTTARLSQCFAKVFPGLTEAETLEARAGELPAWDSLATLNLLALIEEEFGVSIDLDDFDESPSFKSFLAAIQSSLTVR